VVRETVEHKARFDPLTRARELNALDSAASVLSCEIFGGGAGRLDNARIENKLLCVGWARGVDVRDRLRGSLDGGLAGAQFVSAGDDAILSCAKADDRGGSDPHREDDSEDRLAPVVGHGVHSIRRAAVPSTINRGTPTKPRGTGIA
jgi:hypothetical protein